MRYLPHTTEEVATMLATIGKPNVDALFSSIDNSVRLKEPLQIPTGMPELQLKRALEERKGKLPATSFLGAGVTPHFAPEIVSQLLLRGEWYTAYTPYQPEVSQGTLQAIFEFQTIVASLFGCEIANASMYDGATALAEALLASVRIKKNTQCVILSESIHPEYRQVCKTYLDAARIEIITIPINAQGKTDLLGLKALFEKHKSQNTIASIAYQTPNFLGQREDEEEIIQFAKAHNLLTVATVTEPLALALCPSPGSLGADFVVGEGLGFCGHTSLGGPGVGLFATSKQYVRQMPGRLCGLTTDINGKPGYVLTLAAREQHIRREKATSNICTNHNLMALAFTITLSLYGKKGLIDLAQQNIRRTIQLRKLLTAAGLQCAFNGSYFNETVIKFASESILQQKIVQAQRDNVYPGISLNEWYPQLEGHLLVTTTELHTDDDLKNLISVLS